MKSKSNKALIGSGIITAIAASLCCITPVLALIAGTSGLASTFSWLEPLRPYLIGLTLLVLAFAWYQKLKPKKEIDCDCETDKRPRFSQTKTFLGIITIFALLMLAFPYYSSIYYPNTEKQIIVVEKSNIQTVDFKINGMTCNSCAEHIDYEVNKQIGVISSTVSFEDGNAIIEFDSSRITTSDIERSINSTGYAVTDVKEN